MYCSRQVPDDPSPQACPVGNPVYPSTGIKIQAETDYQGPDGLAFVRTYRSNTGYFASVANGGWIDNTAMGATGYASVPGKVVNGTSSRLVSLKVIASGKQEYYLMAADGRRIEFAGPPDAIAPKSAGTGLAVARQTDAQGAVEWRVTQQDGGVEVYNAQGAPVSSSTPAGLKTTYAYSDASTPAAVAPRPGLLVSMTGPSDRSLRFSYNAAGQMATLTDPAGGVTRYGYDADNNLASVAYPDGTSKTYLYNEPANTANTSQPHALTGIIDENGVRYATYRYDASGKAISTEHAGGADKHRFAYYGSPITRATVTDPLGTPRTYGFATVAGAQRETGVSQPGGSGCAAASDKITYDASGNVASRKDFNGNLSCHAYDPARNLETVRVEGIAPGGTCPADLAAYTPKPGSAERKTATAWHPAYRLPARIDEAGRSTLFSYDTQGNLTGKTVQDTATGEARSWAWAYNASGQVLTEDGPRTDLADITTYAYYSDSTATHQPGDLRTVTNAAGHVTTFTAYDANGKLLSFTDPNGLVVSLAYDPRGRLSAKTVDGNTTAYQYDGAGNLLRVTLPTGVFYTYRYDPAHRLTDVTDALGGKIRYTLDAAGHRTKEDIFEADGTLVKTHRRQYDALGRLAQDIGAYNQTTRYEYDANGNLTKQTDPAGHATTYTYDPLNRLKTQTDALQGITRFAYDGQDRLIQVSDANHQTTAYQYNGLGDLLQETGPNRGTLQYAFDAAGNLTQKTDAAGAVSTYAYDALNRLRQADLPGTADDISYTYDYWSQANAGIGRLYKVSNSRVTLKLGYDLSGRVTAQSLTLSGSYAPLTSVSYCYDAAGWPSGLTYPSGNRLDYLRDASGEMTAATFAQNGQTATLAGNLQHTPFGPLHSLGYGNGLSENRFYDLDGRLLRQTLAGWQDQFHTYDPAGNLTDLADSLAPANSQHFGYDALDRLNTATGGYGNLAYTYDLDGNRLSETRNGKTTPYSYLPNSQRLQSAGVTSYGYDANGNTTQAGAASYVYSPFNQLQQASLGNSPIAQYGYDPLGRRFSKTVGGNTTYYLYNPEGQLLAELDSNGTAKTEHLWLEGQPLAVLQNGQLAYVHPDRLGTPRLITDTTGIPIWRWESDPFGTTPANPDPDGDGVPFVYNLRFPGQYFDAETGLNYNMARYYDSGIGAYRESDPIGLRGGINTYAYVRGNAVNKIDPEGLHDLGPVIGRIIGNILDIIDPPPSDAANDEDYKQCPPDTPDKCDLERASIIKEEISIQNDIQSGPPRFGPNGGNEIFWASSIRAKKKAWNEWVNDYNRRCPRKIGRRFKL